ncbi:hypothetical protein ASG32_18790 [Methylobacterium sp. Leaf361]|nr:hypothetical protein ASG32_18790 [Methylobacterium sp. Leaf361]
MTASISFGSGVAGICPITALKAAFTMIQSGLSSFAQPSIIAAESEDKLVLLPTMKTVVISSRPSCCRRSMPKDAGVCDLCETRSTTCQPDRSFRAPSPNRVHAAQSTNFASLGSSMASVATPAPPFRMR